MKPKDLILFLSLVVLAFLFWQSARSGYAARLTESALANRNLELASKAVKLSPADARTQLILGALLEVNNNRTAAISHYQNAVAQRPRDYVLYMQLARAQELEGTRDAAINSAQVAAKLAPYYAQPHWQLGNLLVRAGRTDQGYAELRLGGASNPALLPAIIDLAWQMERGDVEAVKRAIAPQSPRAHLALGDYLKKQKKYTDAAAMYLVAGTGEDARIARKQFISELINANEFIVAHQVWSSDSPDHKLERGLLNPGFEEQTDLSDPFGWHQAESLTSTPLGLDDAKPKERRWSLRIDFNGETNTSVIISQLVLIEPNASYQLRFAARTENVTSGGLPRVSVLDAAGNKLIAESAVLPQSSSGWRDYPLDFKTGAQTTAIRIALQRLNCSTPQCPIFGKLWLDGFELRKL